MNCLFVGGPECGKVHTVELPMPPQYVFAYPKKIDIFDNPNTLYETCERVYYNRKIYMFGDGAFKARRPVYVFNELDKKEWWSDKWAIRWLHNSAVIELIEKHWPAVAHKLRWHYL